MLPNQIAAQIRNARLIPMQDNRPKGDLQLPAGRRSRLISRNCRIPRHWRPSGKSRRGDYQLPLNRDFEQVRRARIELGENPGGLNRSVQHHLI